MIFAALAFVKTRRQLAIEAIALRHQRSYAERVIGTLRRELLDYVIVMNERHLRRLLRVYAADHYHRSRTHLSLDKDSPERRPVEPPEIGNVVELPLLGGLHHRYTRRAA